MIGDAAVLRLLLSLQSGWKAAVSSGCVTVCSLPKLPFPPGQRHVWVLDTAGSARPCRAGSGSCRGCACAGAVAAVSVLLPHTQFPPLHRRALQLWFVKWDQVTAQRSTEHAFRYRLACVARYFSGLFPSPVHWTQHTRTSDSFYHAHDLHELVSLIKVSGLCVYGVLTFLWFLS